MSITSMHLHEVPEFGPYSSSTTAGIVCLSTRMSNHWMILQDPGVFSNADLHLFRY